MIDLMLKFWYYKKQEDNECIMLTLFTVVR